MVLDSSAVVAILLEEPESVALSHAIQNDTRRLFPSIAAVEAGIVLQARKGDGGAPNLNAFLAGSGVDLVAFTGEHSALAGLNLVDCCVYAVAKLSGQPLLFKGGDFALTDLAAVPY